MWTPSDEQSAEIAREYTRIGVGKGDRLPLPRGLASASDYLSFLRQVPDASGVPGFTATMAGRATRS